MVLGIVLACLPCCCVCWIGMTVALGFGMVTAGVFLQKAESWEVRTAWRQAECEVLAAGVSCVDEEKRSTCSGYKMGYMPTQRVPVFLTEHIATCPGTYWCSKEQEICNCTGEITYSPELFPGSSLAS